MKGHNLSIGKTLAGWKLNPPKDRALLAGVSAASLALFCLGLTLMFPPGAGLFSVAFGLGSIAVESTPAWRRWKFGREMKRKHGVLLPDDEPLARIVAEVSGKFGRARPPKIYVTKGKDDNYFVAEPGVDALVTTRAALEKFKSEPALRFIAAHEVAHLQVDGSSPILAACKVMNRTGDGFGLLFIAAWGLPLIGLGLPFALDILPGALSFVGSAAAGAAAAVGVQFGLRFQERRADKNALYVTRDLQGGESALESLESAGKKTPSFLVELLRSHPSHLRRLKSLRESFNTVAQHQPPAPVEETANALSEKRPPQPVR